MKKNLLLLTLFISFISCDITQFFFLGKIWVPFLTCLYCTLLFDKDNKYPIALAALLLCIEAFALHNFFFAPVTFIIPSLLSIIYLKKNLYHSMLHSITISLLCSMIQLYGIEGHLFAIYPPNNYAIIKICATIIVTTCFYLTISFWGRLSNRL